MPVYKVFTWNMQRAQSISRTDATIRERYRVLQTLVNWADVGFITEPGKDIRTGLNNFQLPGLNRHFYASQMGDNQTDASACRPVVFSKTPISHPTPDANSYVQYLSGGANASRYPAAGMVDLPPGSNKLLLVSFHATSGFGADENSRTYFDNFYPRSDRGFRAPHPAMVWIVGGDFNCNAGNGVYMPTTYTHQSSHTLDGFFADQYDTRFVVTDSVAAYTYLNGHTTGEGNLETNVHINPHGYVVNGHHLSDHCPVCAELKIERISVRQDDMNADTALIVTGTRTRRKSVKYGTSMDVDTTS
jgi:hypothetical protein